MKIKNEYLKKSFEALSKFNDESFYQSSLFNSTLISVKEEKLVFKHLTRESNTELVLKNIEMKNIEDEDLGKALLNTTRITKLLKEIDSDEIITYKKDEKNIELRTKNGEYKLATWNNLEEFEIKFSSLDNQKLLATVYLTDFIDLINDVKRVTLDNKPNTLMSLMNFIFEKNQLSVYTTDGYRIARSHIYYKNNDKEITNSNEETIKLNVVGKLIKKYIDFIVDIYKLTSDEILKIYKNDNKIVFSTESTTCSIVLSSISFHDLSPHFLVPKNTVFVVNAKELKDAINRLNSFVRNSTELSILEYSQKKIILSSSETRFNNSGKETIAMENFSGENGIIKFTASHLKNSLYRFYQNSITITINSPQKPFLLHSIDIPLMFVILPITSY